ncbi:WG repeat-containing protein [Psychrobacter sp. I-STPA10]|uniref:WG repeat-containing protein n=1 Tax=Psychrobacter sp. I-STPA10 TaxID=2585769 RepID=UPI001E2B018F|nr:WG repeat-containing protein [Psychrobacter sp. I-STPA10]
MKANNTILSLVFAVSFIGLLSPMSALAKLQVFDEDSNDGYQCGYKNEKGQVIVPAKYYSCGDFSDGLARVVLTKPVIINGYQDLSYWQGYINESGKLVIPIKYEAPIFDGVFIDYRDFHQGMVVVYKDGKYGYMDKTGKLTIPYQYESASDFHEDVAVVSQDDKYGVINQQGKLVVPYKFDWLGDYSDGLALYRVGSWGYDDTVKFGFVDKTGKTVIKPIWDEAMEFSEGRAAVKVGDYETGKWGVIDQTGKFIVTPKYDMAYIEPMGDMIEVDGGRYQDGKLEVYNLNKKGADQYMEYGSITRYVLNRQGQVIEQKDFADWDAVEKERYPEYDQ